MSDTVFFQAPWDQKLTLMTLVSSLVLIGSIVLVLWLALTLDSSPAVRFVLGLSLLLPLTALVGAALLAPRGYAIDRDCVRVERWVGAIRISLSEIRSVESLPAERLHGSIRTFGSGGLCGYYGRFRNAALGSYQMYATRSEGYVLIQAAHPYVLTPETPDRFVDALSK